MTYKQIRHAILLVILYFMIVISLHSIAFCVPTQTRRPTDSYTLFKEGTRLYDVQQYKKAIEKFQQAYRIDMTSGDLNAAWMNLNYIGLSYQAL